MRKLLLFMVLIGAAIAALALLPGRVYRLEVLEIDPAGRPVARVVTPFRRETAEALAAVPGVTRSL